MKLRQTSFSVTTCYRAYCSAARAKCVPEIRRGPHWPFCFLLEHSEDAWPRLPGRRWKHR